LAALGITAGAVAGLWSFDGPFPAPPGFTSYDDLPRRFLRLAHTAAIYLPLLNLAYVATLSHTRLSLRAQRFGCRALLAGTIGLPLVLAGAAFWPALKYLLPLPAACVLGAVWLLAASLARGMPPAPERRSP
jgi:hypothetical protein